MVYSRIRASLSIAPPAAGFATMDPEDATYRLRVALSYQHHAGTLLTNARSAFENSALDSERFESLRGFYEGHLARASRLLDSLRAAEKRRLIGIEWELNQERNRKSQLSQRAARGRVPALDANEQSREHGRKIQDLAKIVGAARRNLAAESAGDLGGYVELPLDEYPKRLSQRASRPSRGPGAGFAVGLGIALTLAGIAIGVFAMLPKPGTLQISASRTAPAAPIQITLQLTGPDPATVDIPWEEDGAAPPETGDPTRYGIQVWISESDETFRLMPGTLDCWRYQGAKLYGRGALEIYPGILTVVQFDPAELARLGVKPVAVRFSVVAADGIELGNATVGPRE